MFLKFSTFFIIYFKYSIPYGRSEIIVTWSERQAYGKMQLRNNEWCLIRNQGGLSFFYDLNRIGIILKKGSYLELMKIKSYSEKKGIMPFIIKQNWKNTNRNE